MLSYLVIEYNTFLRLFETSRSPINDRSFSVSLTNFVDYSQDLLRYATKFYERGTSER